MRGILRSVPGVMCVMTAVVFMAAPSWGKVVFVDVNSKYNADGGDGSAVRPFRTLTDAMTDPVNGSVEGDTILVEAGTYDETTGEVYPIVIDHSVAIIGRGKELTRVEINDNWGVMFTGVLPAGSVPVGSLVVDGIGFQGNIDLTSVLEGIHVNELVVRNCSFDGLWVAFLSINPAGVPPYTISIIGNTGGGPQTNDCGWMERYFNPRGMWDRIELVNNKLSRNWNAIDGGETTSGLMMDNIFTDYCGEAAGLSGKWQVLNNVIARSLDNGREGIELVNGDNSSIVNNTIWGFDQDGIFVRGADLSTVEIVNNIVANNSGGINWNSTYGTPLIRNNNVFGNTADYPAGLDQTGINGNISVDPLLDVDGIHLTAASQCIDAGEDVSWLLTTDIDFETRVAPFDIGADEYMCSTADADGDGWTECGGDCDDSDPDVNPDKNEKGKRRSDGKDNDCNGIIDG